MDKVTWVKNFAMCKEISIAGKFIYDGMLDLNRMVNYVDDENIFCFLYKVSVGIERLQKIAYILLRNPGESEYEAIEKELITHSHAELHNKIKKLTNINLSTHQNAFIQMLGDFYKTYRYDRFNLNTDLTGERSMFIKYVRSRLGEDIQILDIFVSPVSEKTKKFLGKIIGHLAKIYYDLIYEQSVKLNIYAYELDSCSKSMKIFHNDCNEKNLQQQFINEQIAFKELLIFLMNTSKKSGFYDFIKEIPPLDIDIALVQDYLLELVKGDVPQVLIDEVEFLYSEEEGFYIKERLEMLNCMNNRFCCFDDEDELFDDFPSA